MATPTGPAEFRMVFSGVLMVAVGCILAMAPPPLIPHYRSWIAFHIEHCANGVLLAVLGAVVLPRMALGRGALLVFEIMAHYGTWINGTALAVMAFTGKGSPLAPRIAAESGITDMAVPSVPHVLLLSCGLTMTATLILALVGLAQGTRGKTVGAAPAGGKDE